MRAPDAIVRELLDESQWHILHAEAAAKGRAGVLVADPAAPPNSAGELLENQPVATRSNIGEEYFDDSGRWVEADYVLPNGKTLTVVSATFTPARSVPRSRTISTASWSACWCACLSWQSTRTTCSSWAI